MNTDMIRLSYYYQKAEKLAELEKSNATSFRNNKIFELSFPEKLDAYNRSMNLSVAAITMAFVHVFLLGATLLHY